MFRVYEWPSGKFRLRMAFGQVSIRDVAFGLRFDFDEWPSGMFRLEMLPSGFVSTNGLRSQFFVIYSRDLTGVFSCDEDLSEL
jgi:hypothetical protein